MEFDGREINHQVHTDGGVGEERPTRKKVPLGQTVPQTAGAGESQVQAAVSALQVILSSWNSTFSTWDPRMKWMVLW